MGLPDFTDGLLGFFNWYGIFFASGIIISLIVSLVRCHRRGIDLIHVEVGFIVLAVVGLFGARLISVVSSPASAAQISGFVSFWQEFFGGGGNGIAGFSILGAVLFVGPAVVAMIAWSSWKTGISSLVYLEAIIPSFVIGQAVGRMGNFFNQEIFLDISFSDAAYPEILRLFTQFFHLRGATGELLNPLFLYEAFSDITLFFFVVFVFPKIKGYFYGLSTPIVMIWWGLFRTITENFRNSSDQLGLGIANPSLVLAGIVLGLGFALLIWLIIWKKVIVPRRKQPRPVAHITGFSTATGIIDTEIDVDLIKQKKPIKGAKVKTADSFLTDSNTASNNKMLKKDFESNSLENKKLADEILEEIDYFKNKK